MVDGAEERYGRRPVYRKLAARRRAPPRTCLPSTTNRLLERLPSTVYLSIAGGATICYMIRSEPAHSHAHGHRATFVSVSMAPSRWAFHAASLTSEGAAASSPWAEHGSSNCLRTAVASPHFRPAWSLQSHRGLAGHQPGRGQCSAWRHKARTPTTHCVSQCAPPVQ